MSTPGYFCNINLRAFAKALFQFFGLSAGQPIGFDANGQVKNVTALPAEIVIAASDETTVIAAGTGKVTFRMPYAMTVTAVRASLKTAASTGTFTVDINEGGTSILSTKLTLDATEKTSTTAATPAVISDANLADDAEITVDVDDAGAGDGVGLKIVLSGTRA